MKRYNETEQIESEYLRCGLSLRRDVLYRGLAHWGGILLYALAGFFAFDYLLRIPYPVRFLMVVAGVAYLAREFLRQSYRPYKREVTADEVALLLERAHPELESRLISALQFQRLIVIPAGVSENLVEGVVEQAYAQAKKLDVWALLDRSWLRKGAAFAGGALLLWLLLAALFPAQSGVFALRLLAPFVDYPKRTYIESVELPKIIPEGEAARVSITVSGILPGVGVAYFTSAESGEEREFEFVAEPDKPEAFILELPPLFSAGELVIYIGDDRWGPQEITPEKRPIISSARLEVKPPEYTGIAPYTLDSASAVVPKGSKLELTITANKQVEKAAMLSHNGEPLKFELRKEQEGKVWVSQMDVQDSFAYSVRMQDKFGLVNFEPPVYSVTVRHDQAPSVRVMTPEPSMEIAPGSKLPLEFEVRDDYKIQSVAVRYQVYDVSNDDDVNTAEQGYNDRARPIRTYLELQPQQQVYLYKGLWDNLKEGVIPGKVIRLWIEAKDNSPEGNTFRTSDYLIRVISAEEYRAILMQRLGSQMDGAEEIIDNIMQGTRDVRRIKGE